MINCIFVSDLHGRRERYEKLFREIRENRPDIVFFGGDLLPHSLHRDYEEDFLESFLFRNFLELKNDLKDDYPRIYMILGNDDPWLAEERFISLENEGVWKYLHNRIDEYLGYTFYGYANVPPTPFRYKDWERYDVSRYVDPGCIPPEEGIHTMQPPVDLEWATIKDDLVILAGMAIPEKSVFLFHSPPYKTYLDRAALDGKMIEHVPMDVHVGSIAIMRFIEEKQPWVTLHGHIHESSQITGHWRQQFGRTHSFSAAWQGPELALVEFNLENPSDATRRLL